MKILPKILFLLLSLNVAKCFLTKIEWKIAMGLIKKTHVRNCLIAPEKISYTSAAKIVKTLSKIEVSTVFLKRNYLKEYMEQIDMKIFRWTAVLLKEKTLGSVNYFNNKTIISSYFWLIFDASNGTLRQELRKTEIPFDCALLLIEKINKNHYLLSEYYKIKKYTPGVFSQFAEWRNNNLVIAEKDWFDRKSNMQKYEFTTVKFNEELYITPKDKVNEEIWQELSYILNFTIVEKYIQYSVDKSHMDLETEEDEALLDSEIYLGRKEKYTYLLGPISQTKLFLHVRVLGEDEDFERFLKPFSKKTWHSIGLWILFYGFIICFIEYLHGRLKNNKRQQYESFFLFFIPLNSLCNQSGSGVSNNMTSRSILFLIRMSGSIIFYAYAAIFISYLFLFIPKLPFTNLKDFVKDGTYKIEGERNSDVDTYFSISPDPLEKLIYKKFLSDVKKWSRFDKAVDKMCAGEKLVLVGYDNDIDNYMPCNIVKIKKPLKIFSNGFKIRFRSPFRGILHIKLLLLRNTGILQRVNKKIISIRAKKFERKECYEISLEKVASVFIILVFGFILSIGILLIEIVIWKLKNRYKRPTKDISTEFY